MPKSRTKTSLDAIDMLKQDHDKAEKAFKEFEKMDRQDAEACRRLVAQTCEELKVHTALEEEIFYPAVREAIEDEDLLNEAQVEHTSAKDLIRQLENMKPDDPMYEATFRVLGEYVLHHAKEEESEMFPQVRKSDLDLEALAEKLMARKEELTASLPA